MAQRDEILVVVPALNEARHIVGCLDQLLCDDPGLALIVADGGSTDATRALVTNLMGRYPNLQLVDNPDRLQSAGINRAVAVCAKPEHRILVRCDAHAGYPPGFVMAVAAALDARAAASVVVPMDSIGQTGFARAAAWVVDTPLGSGGSAHRGGRRSGMVDHGHHAGMALDWFRRIGGYDPGFSHNEDAEYDHRLRLAGGEIWLEAGIRLDYVMRPTFGGLARQYWNYGRGRARTVMKHRMRPRLRQLIPAVNLAGMVLALGLALVWPWALVWPLAYLLALGLVSLAGVRAIGFDGVWAGSALFAMHNFWAAGFLTQMVRGRR
jgi:succinoglycan biosynthesis protein ExoA